MNNKEYIEVLIARYLSGEATPEEAIDLEDWKSMSAENQKYFDDCKLLYGAENGDANENFAWEQVSQQITKLSIIRPLYSRPSFIISIAAAITLLLGIALVMKYYSGYDKVRYLSLKTNQENKSILLADHTEIDVKANSEITYSADYGRTNRKVNLKGSAYFNVTHSDKLPFVVDAGQVFIKDIGTRFLVNTSKDTDTVYVKVDEGVVLLFDSAGSELLIKATEKAVYIRSVKKIIKEESTEAKKMPELNFEDETLGQVALALEKAFELTVEIENKATKSCRITTRFNKSDIEEVLIIITETLGLSFEKTPSGYIIKGNSCSK